MSQFEISKPTADEIRMAASNPAVGWYSPYRFLARHDLRDFQAAEGVHLAADAKSTLFTVRSGGLSVGTISCTDNPWETELFGRKMGVLKLLQVNLNAPSSAEAIRALIAHAIDWARQRGTECLLCKVHTDDMWAIHALERAEFRLMDTLLDYVYDYRKNPLATIPPPKPFAGIVRPAEPNDEEQLAVLARVAFEKHFGRYHADERLPRARVSQVYEQWVKASFKGWSDAMLVAEIQKRVVGISIWKNPSAVERHLPVKVGHYSLGAVHPDYAGQGIFGALTYAGMKLYEGKIDCLEGPTHINNYPVQHGYGRLLWRIADARHSFHRWINDRTSS
ncbi:MAG: hypothetical protein HYX71_06615 [Opitutae bacterium]|nr:hypothetical protein [Opitutae bacterium]